jgi:hypothetical protein
MAKKRPCPECDGSGVGHRYDVVGKPVPCNRCSGTGFVERSKKLEKPSRSHAGKQPVPDFGELLQKLALSSIRNITGRSESGAKREAVARQAPAGETEPNEGMAELRRKLIGRWRRSAKYSTSATVTTYWFSADGTYTKHEESSSFYSSVMGTTSSSSANDDAGTFSVIAPRRLRFDSVNYGPSEVNFDVDDWKLTMDYLEYFR